MKARMKNDLPRRVLLPALLALLLILPITVLTACGGKDPEHDTTDVTTVETPADTGDGTQSETLPGTEPDTVPTETEAPSLDTETETDAVTDDDTEAETEAETEPPSDRTMLFYEGFPVSQMLTGSGFEMSVEADGDGYVLAVRRTSDRAQRISVKFDAYLESLGLPVPDAGTLRYVAAEIRKGPAEGAAWEPLLIPVTADSVKTAKDGSIKTLYLPTFAGMPKNGESWYLRSVSVASSMDEVMQVLGLTQYVLGYGSTLDLSASDPVNHVKITAPDEDDGLSFWFDHFTEKVNCDTVPVKDTVGYTIQMAKNEYEACQFFLSAPTDRRFTVQYTPFTNDAGASLHTELRVEFYPTEGAGLTVPDCLIPYESYVGFDAPEDVEWSYDVPGCVSVPAGTTRGFVMQAKTTADTAPGLYRSDLMIHDAETGKCVKAAAVYTYVFNVTLSDETAMKTHVLCWDSQWLTPYRAWGYVNSGRDENNILRALSDFLLDYRVCTQMNWGEEWLDNPRVTSVGISDGSEYENFVAQNKDWNKKFLLYKVDEPAEKQRLDELKNITTQYRSAWEDVRVVCPFETDIRINGDTDQISFMADYVNVWCPKFYCFTPRDLGFIAGTRFTQTEALDKKYGTFDARMQAFRERGDETWIYVSCVPDASAPYLNVLLGNDGTEPETIFWMCYRYRLTGFLYWNLFYWESNGNGNGYLRYPVTKTGPGDGILCYPGCAYGLTEPMPSMRLVGIRDGIEDYQLLTMLEAACGKDMADDLVSHIATSVVTFNTDDDVLHNARVFMLQALENAQK